MSGWQVLKWTRLHNYSCWMPGCGYEFKDKQSALSWINRVIPPEQRRYYIVHDGNIGSGRYIKGPNG